MIESFPRDCEAGDRADIRFNISDKIRLIESLLGVNQKYDISIIEGNAIGNAWLNKVQAVLQGWYLGSMGGNSLADVLRWFSESQRKTSLSRFL